MKNRKMKNDIVLIGVLLVLAVILLFVCGNREAGAYVIVRVNGEETGRYSLSQDGTYELNGGSNILVIENGAAYLTEADCPDKLCVKQGKVKNSGECITCLPNRLTVTVYGAAQGVDFVTG